jgi:DNA helicase II / ATP-dependent DNA helicase PcrA
MDESGLKGLEEERRLAYVGITRAEELCTISFAANRRVYGQWQSSLPSRFIDELPAEHVEVLTPPGLYGGGLRRGGDGRQHHRGAGRRGPTSTTRPAGSGCRTAPRPPDGQPREARTSPSTSRRSRPSPWATACSTRNSATAPSSGIEGDKLDIAFDKAGAREEEGATANYREPREEEGISELGASGPCGPSADNSKIAACCRCTMLFVRNAAMQKVHEYH